MLRRFFVLASAVSLALCIGTIFLWAKSYHVIETWHREEDSTWSEVTRVSGRVYWIKAVGVVVQRQDAPVNNWAVADIPRKRLDDWGVGYLPDRCFYQFPGDGRLITSEKSLLPILDRLSQTTQTVSFLGVQHLKRNVAGRMHCQELVVPFALIFAICSIPLLAVLAALGRLLLVRERGIRRVLAQRCRRCGYDIRVTTDVCPECGTPMLSAEEKMQRSIARLRC